MRLVLVVGVRLVLPAGSVQRLRGGVGLRAGQGQDEAHVRADERRRLELEVGAGAHLGGPLPALGPAQLAGAREVPAHARAHRQRVRLL